ncbi:TetR/AcrR family transcriptional regulator [Shewanella fidelis]|uniref:TetR/AcrR family transcriptional regulator n=1 Tax=Shewanella fidelis TaxID=173509 RepID=A0AAW8NRU7_9GAMM|nr:TetR/AcrR family transcriptional regulator [Shewanella fidelis]MDR8525477.1 TetR/AcrR family transcriptional regulator [Shewanella fidelis]MDW4813204.1 TetR/AcrR family transcriptional regulator [Shewanella fidelis]MDW4816916.1 TetR/AcrR family transcriptional regulator [Shewanella fidelis]MDW4820075.1 TetR/AcrR family transcriptional regulator [Shewanella fidelis]MDW4825669.1 TetR/AcrR family transcriptional regulator [Shewanella fidelis]
MIRQAREVKLLDIARELILEHGMVSFKFTDITKRAEVSRATLYKYFSGKEDVLVSLFVHDAGITKQMLLDIQLDPTLNNREKILLSLLAPVASSMETLNRSGTLLLSANPGIFMYASDKQKARLEQIVSEIRQITLEFWLTPFKQGHMEVTQEQLEEVMALTFPYQRGCIVIPQSVMTVGKHIHYPLRKVFENLLKSTEALNWCEEHANVDYEKVLIGIGRHKKEGMIAC